MMRALLLLAAVQAAPQEEAEPVLAERAAIAGMAGIHTVSTLTYVGAPDLPNELEALYVFPDRCVWRRRALGGNVAERTVTYRAGDACWLVEAGTGTSRRLPDGDRDFVVLQMELRRAVMLWPDGFAWSGEGELRTAPVATGGAEASLVALLGDGGRPKRVTSFNGDGEELEALVEIEWSEPARPDARVFPRTFELAFQGTPIWIEEVHQVGTNVRFLDYTFRPPDRRPELAPELLGLGRPSHLDLRRASVRRAPLPEGVGWDAAFARARLLWIEGSNDLADIDRELEPGANFELAADGSPTAIVLVVDGPVLAPTSGDWTVRAEVPAVSIFVEGRPTPPAKLLAAAREALPPRARTGTPFLRTDPAAKVPERSQLVLPLRP